MALVSVVPGRLSFRKQQMSSPGLEALSKLKTCSRCLLAETHDTVVFDKDLGICNICKTHESRRKAKYGGARLEDLSKLLDRYQWKSYYDCIVPFSGGKDSTFTLWYLVKEIGLKCLAVTFDHSFMRPVVQENNARTFSILGCNHISYQPDPNLVRRLMKESLLRKGDFCWHCHTGIFAYPMHMAIEYKIPLIIWGQPNTEYNAFYKPGEREAVDEQRFNRYVNLGITADCMVGMLNDGTTLDDLSVFRFPHWKDLLEIGYTSVNLGAFIPWDVKKQVEIIKRELGWKEDPNEGIPPEYGYEKIECRMQGVRDYLRFLKRGMGRANHLASVDIRDGRLTREEGLKMVAKYDGRRPQALDEFLGMVGMSEKEFLASIEIIKVKP